MNLYPFTLISSQMGRCGFKEDDWQIITHIYNEKDLLKALKEGYLTDARNRNNFPITSHEIDRVYLNGTSLEQSYGCECLGYYDEEDEDDVITDYRYVDGDFTTEQMDLLKEVHNKFNKWKSKIKTLLPRLKKLAREQEKIKNDLKNLKRLAKEYGYTLTKEI
jgi:hypothetical protein